MFNRLNASLLAGLVAILVNTAALKLADAIGLATAHGGLLRLIGPWIGTPLGWLGVSNLWRSMGGPPASSAAFQTGFHIVVGLAMGVFYAFAIDPIRRGKALLKGLLYAAAVWCLNAAVVLPLTGEGFAGARHLSVAGMVWFGAAHTLFFVVLALLHEKLRPAPRFLPQPMYHP
ncbi:MAG TPA: hypothetical protein VHB27_18385 [Rhodopila sp.]|uniref:hypothetical protein n=1 Tax=Rhodopila sp. TaxID=2480087 RepID=UPI002C9BE759|nr:hypothetical protein [Rhodopila sp.]HVY17198.1 hypothetical protein [Rhodopila sp.]